MKVIADLLDHELENNPDGQVQFVDGQPVDSVSNPFALTWSSGGSSWPTAGRSTS